MTVDGDGGVDDDDDDNEEAVDFDGALLRQRLAQASEVMRISLTPTGTWQTSGALSLCRVCRVLPCRQSLHPVLLTLILTRRRLTCARARVGR